MRRWKHASRETRKGCTGVPAPELYLISLGSTTHMNRPNRRKSSAERIARVSSLVCEKSSMHSPSSFEEESVSPFLYLPTRPPHLLVITWRLQVPQKYPL